ncbi:MAG TPA: CcmD family protein [Edaphocola sp.]|nr:CcmD family protein [Edaphocola sp.]
MNSKKYLNSLFLFLFSLLPIASFAQAPAMADKLRTDGKIYVVIVVILTIFIGIVIYLFSLDKKISKIEKENNLK